MYKTHLIGNAIDDLKHHVRKLSSVYSDYAILIEYAEWGHEEIPEISETQLEKVQRHKQEMLDALKQLEGLTNDQTRSGGTQ